MICCRTIAATLRGNSPQSLAAGWCSEYAEEGAKQTSNKYRRLEYHILVKENSAEESGGRVYDP
jgi:hypothetical protein